MRWGSRVPVTVPWPGSPTSAPWATPGACPSMRTWNRTGAAAAAGPMTRCRSRAWNRQGNRPPAGLHGAGVFGIVPSPAQGPVVAPELGRDFVAVRLVRYGSAGRGEVVGAVVACVVLRRPEAGPVGWRLWPPGLGRPPPRVIAGDVL